MTINATMINEQADKELTGQRAKFSRRFDGKGAARDLSLLFPAGPLSDASDSFDETKDRFLKELYTNGIRNDRDFHPDFDSGYAAETYTYQRGKNIFSNDLEAADKPSKMGPNLKIPTIDDNGQPIVEEGHTRVEPEGGQLGNGKGFGTSFSRNQPGTYSQPDQGSSYIERKDSEVEQAVPRLGEYININNYLTDPSA